MARTPGVPMAGGDLPWAEIEPLYADLSMPVARIAKRYGVAASWLVNEVKRLGWPSRGEMRRRSAAPPPAGKHAEGSKTKRRANTSAAAKRSRSDAVKGAGTEKTTDVHPRTLVKRIYKTIDRELTKLEDQTGKTSQDRERASRALSQMVSSLEKAVEMQREIAKDKGQRPAAKDKEALKHAEELRREIADRLERLHRKRATGK